MPTSAGVLTIAVEVSRGGEEDGECRKDHEIVCGIPLCVAGFRSTTSSLDIKRHIRRKMSGRMRIDSQADLSGIKTNTGGR